ncbi:hypothetical protein [Sulfurospirillum arcachonense]|uniref:hypothetical protein n=1 Tax=Sulfurospirillum arcachonense TaxID=57666 RepID=UPI0004695663|nr:hypothetical protein [Sulfurospirillum arcachonense]
MILYSKNGDFIGIGKDELSFLGYEDLDEFSSIHNDVADLFINKPGYIFKFKNFSWIDYALHSGAPRKSVLVKLKTGNEVETAIKIKELFLYNKTDGEDLYYCIEFDNGTNQMASSFVQSTPILDTNTEQDTTNEIETKEIPINEDFEEDLKEPSTEFNATNEPTPKLKIDNNLVEQEDYSSENKLPIEEDYLSQTEDIQTKIKIDGDFSEDYSNENKLPIEEDYLSQTEDIQTKIKIDGDFSEDVSNLTIEPDIDESNDINIAIKSDFEKKELEEDLEFDLATCVETLGLDIGLVGELLTDYMDQIEKTIPEINLNIEQDNMASLHDNIYSLKGVSDNLHMKQISSKLVNILKATDKKTQIEELNNFEKVVAQLKGEFL